MTFQMNAIDLPIIIDLAALLAWQYEDLSQ